MRIVAEKEPHLDPSKASEPEAHSQPAPAGSEAHSSQHQKGPFRQLDLMEL